MKRNHRYGQRNRAWTLWAAVLAVLGGCVSPYFHHLEMIDAVWHEDKADMRRHLHFEPELIDGLTGATDNFAPIHGAAVMGDLNMIRLLVRHGAAMRIWGSGGVLPIHCAAANGHTDVVKYFVQKGFDVDAGGAEGAPLHYAVRNGHREVAEYLIAHGANVNLSIFNAPTPLHVAGREGQSELAALLLAHGAEPNSRDSRDRTPADLAELHGHHETATLIRRHETGVMVNKLAVNH